MIVDPRFEQDGMGLWYWTIRNLGDLGIGILNATARFPTKQAAEDDFLNWCDLSASNSAYQKFNANTTHGPVLISARMTNAGAVVDICWGRQDDARLVRYTFRGSMPEYASESLTVEITARMALSHFERTHTPIPQTLLFRIGEIDYNGALTLIPLA